MPHLKSMWPGWSTTPQEPKNLESGQTSKYSVSNENIADSDLDMQESEKSRDDISEGAGAPAPIEDNVKHPRPGTREWLQVLAAHFIIQITWGFINSFGVFMSYYEDALNEDPSRLAWIGSIQVCLIFMVAPLAGWLHDRGHFRPTIIAGSFFVCFGVFMASFTNKFWQILLAQGLSVGIGNGLLFCCTTALVQSHFRHHWPNVATALALAGAATGGMIFPAMFENILPKVGFAWTMRSISLYMLIVMIFANLCLRSDMEPRKDARVIDKAALRQTTFWLYTGGMFFVYLALFFGYYHITPFGRRNIGVPRKEAINLLLTMNGIGFVGRAASGYFSDAFTGPMNMMVLFTCVSGTLIFCMIAVHNVPGLWIFATIYGIFAAGVQSLFPSALAVVSPDTRKRGVRLGMTCFIVGQAALIGPPIEGVLVAKYGYKAAQIFAGLSWLLGTAIIVATRVYLVGPKLMKKC